MKHLRKLLFPFAALYYCGVWIRNYCYDKGICKSQSYDFPIICIGNLSTGGTGKTPMTEYLIRFFQDRTSLGVLSRGYGRKTKGYIQVAQSHTAIEVGDEPLQYASKFKDVTVAVCEDRRTGLERLRALENVPDVVLLDDAFQHRKVTAGYSILLSSYTEPFYDDYVLPAGNLRDLRHQARRAQVIVITKCPTTITKGEQEAIRSKVAMYTESTVYFASIDYDDNVLNEQGAHSLLSFKNKEFTLITGIANPAPLVQFLKNEGLSFTHKPYKDHYNFTRSDLAFLAKSSCILTTEKDYMRLKSVLRHAELYYLPITTQFIASDGVKFKKDVLSYSKA